MVIGLDFDFPSSSFTANGIKTISNKLSSFRVPLDLAVRQVLVPSIRENFNAGGRPVKWGARSPNTRNKGPLLVETGKLKRVATQINMWAVTSETAALRPLPENVFYGAILQSGWQPYSLTKSAPFVDGRPFMMMQQSDEVAIREIFDNWTIQITKKYWK